LEQLVGLAWRQRLTAAVGSRWWASPLVLAAVMLLSTAPLWRTSLPPLIDLPGHIGRYYVELNLGHSPLLQRNWDFHWRLIGNLGVDVLVVPLAAMFGLERAVWLIALLLPPLMIWGVARIARALHRQTSPFVLATAPFALAYPYQFGFLNYWLSCALAFHCFASWIEVAGSRRTDLRRSVLFTVAAFAIWLAHAYGWAVLVVLVAAFELSRSWTGEVSAWPHRALRTAWRAWPVTSPALLMILWRQGAAGAATEDFFNVSGKLWGLLFTLRDQSLWLDVVSLTFASILILVGLRERALRIHPALGLAAACFLGLILLLPGRMFGSAYADVRLWPIFFMVALAAIAPVNLAWRPASVIAGLAIGLFTLRIAVMSAGFTAYDRDYVRHLHALDYVPQGASVAVLTPAGCQGWRHTRLEHLGSLAIVRRNAFVNTQWDIPGAQLLTPLRGRGTAFNADPSEKVDREPDCSAPVAPALTQKIQQIPRDRFDYVWLLGFDAPRLVEPDLRLLYSDERTALYSLTPAASLRQAAPRGLMKAQSARRSQP
jgi:hypothetical protein